VQRLVAGNNRTARAMAAPASSSAIVTPSFQTGGNLIGADASADVSTGATDAQTDRSMAGESESGPDLPDGSRSARLLA
jgi:hypothetical protein